MRPERFLAAWLGGLAALLAIPAVAADAETDAKIKALEEQVEALSTQIQDLKVGTASKYAETQKQITAVAPTIPNGRPTLTSADGAFSASIRSLVQFDMRLLRPGRPPLAPDLSNGSNFRRARLGIDGKVFTDWEYSFILRLRRQRCRRHVDLRRVRSIQRLQSGAAQARRVPAVREHRRQRGLVRPAVSRARNRNRDSAWSGGRRRSFGDSAWCERASASSDRWRYTGGRANQSGVLDEQQALLGRVAYLVSSSPDSKIVLGIERHVDLQPRRRQSAAGRRAEPWRTLPNCAWTIPARTARRRT